MATFVPVDGDPFAEQQPQAGVKLVPVDGDPFASAPAQPAQPKSKADFDALPNGAQYIAPSGTVHVKGEVAPATAPPPAPEESWLHQVATRGPLAASITGVQQGQTLGFGDEIMAGALSPIEAVKGAFTGEDSGKGFTARVADAYGRALDRERGILHQAEQDHPIATMAGNVAGGLALGSGAQEAGLTLLKGAPSVLKGAGEAGIYGAVQGFGSGEGGLDERVRGATYGGVGGALLGGAIGKVAQALGAGSVTKLAPSIDDLSSAAKAAYQKAEDAGVIIGKQSLQDLAKNVKDQLTDFGYLPALHPRVAAAVQELNRVADGNTTLKGADILRRVANNARMSTDPSEAALGSKIVSAIDDHLANLTPDQVVMGNSDDGVKALQEARSLYSRARKATIVEDAAQSADLRAASTGSGGNADNATRQNIRRIIDSPTKSKGFTDAEKAALEKVVRGTKAQNIARLIGKLSPSGNGLMAALGGGMTATNPMIGAPAMATGFIAKKIADGATGRNLAVAEALIRNGGALPMKQLTAAQKAIVDLLTRASGQETASVTSGR